MPCHGYVHCSLVLYCAPSKALSQCRRTGHQQALEMLRVGCLLLAGSNFNRHMALNVLRDGGVTFISTGYLLLMGFSTCRHGRESWLHMTSGLMNLLMTLQVGLMIYGAGGHRSHGGSGESTRHLPPPVYPYCNTWIMSSSPVRTTMPLQITHMAWWSLGFKNLSSALRCYLALSICPFCEPFWRPCGQACRRASLPGHSWMELHLPISLLHVRVASICGLPGKAVHIWCRSLSTWPAPTHSSCTDPRRSLLEVTSIIEGQRSSFQEATRSSWAGRLHSLVPIVIVTLRVPFEEGFLTWLRTILGLVRCIPRMIWWNQWHTQGGRSSW